MSGRRKRDRQSSRLTTTPDPTDTRPGTATFAGQGFWEGSTHAGRNSALGEGLARPMEQDLPQRRQDHRPPGVQGVRVFRRGEAAPRLRQVSLRDAVRDLTVNAKRE